MKKFRHFGLPIINVVEFPNKKCYFLDSHSTVVFQKQRIKRKNEKQKMSKFALKT